MILTPNLANRGTFGWEYSNSLYFEALGWTPAESSVENLDKITKDLRAIGNEELSLLYTSICRVLGYEAVVELHDLDEPAKIKKLSHEEAARLAVSYTLALNQLTDTVESQARTSIARFSSSACMIMELYPEFVWDRIEDFRSVPVGILDYWKAASLDIKTHEARAAIQLDDESARTLLYSVPDSEDLEIDDYSTVHEGHHYISAHTKYTNGNTGLGIVAFRSDPSSTTHRMINEGATELFTTPHTVESTSFPINCVTEIDIATSKGKGSSELYIQYLLITQRLLQIWASRETNAGDTFRDAYFVDDDQRFRDIRGQDYRDELYRSLSRITQSIGFGSLTDIQKQLDKKKKVNSKKLYLGFLLGRLFELAI